MRGLRSAVLFTAFILFASDLQAGLFRQNQDSTSDVSVKVDAPAAPDLAGLKTYQWTPSSERRIDNPKYQDLDLDTWVREAVDRELQAKGYQKQDYGHPDLWVAYVAAINSEVEKQTMRVPMQVHTMGHPRAGMTYVDYEDVTFENPIDKGSLVVGFFSASDRKKLWQASAEGEVRQKAQTESRKERLVKVVSKMMASVPLVSKKNDMDPIVERQEVERQVDARETMRDMRSR